VVAKPNAKITAGMVGATFSITYDEDWEDLTKKVIFKADQLTRIAEGNVVPFEVLRLPGKTLFVGVEGRNSDGEIVIPTVWACVGKILPGANGEIPASTAPSVDSGGSIGGGGASINDNVVSTTTTWSSKKIDSLVGDVETALDAIIAIQEELIGIINFAVIGNEYRAINGMTWGEWESSEYNTDSFWSEDGYMCDPDGTNFHGPDGNTVTPDMVIIADAHYGSY
jgi:hypothetical protein